MKNVTHTCCCALSLQIKKVRLGDVRDADSLKDAAAGCDYLVAAYGMSPPRFAKVSDIWYSFVLYISYVVATMLGSIFWQISLEKGTQK